MRAKVLAFPTNGPSRAGWSSQELAEIYRLEHLLGQRGLLSEIGSGVTDEGEPWLVVLDSAGADISAHITRVDGRYLVMRVDASEPAYAASLREIANSLIHGTPLASEVEPETEGAEDSAAVESWIFVVDEHPEAGAAAPHALTAEADRAPAIVGDDRLEEVGRLLLALIAGVAEMQQDSAAAADQIETALALADPIEDQPPANPTPSPDLGALGLVEPDAAVTTPAAVDAHGDAAPWDAGALAEESHSAADPMRPGPMPADGLGGQDSGPEDAQAAAPPPGNNGDEESGSAAAEDDHAQAADEGLGHAIRAAGPGNQDQLIIGTSGDDIIETGFGNDTIQAGAGNDTVSAGAGNDSVDGGSGDDVLIGGQGDDTLAGGDGNDQLHGGSGSNTIDTGSGNNLVVSESGNDQVSLGDGHDLVVVMPRGAGNTTVTDFDENNDVLVVIGLDEGSHTTVNPNNPGTQVINVTPDTTITITGTSPLTDPLV